MPVNRKVQSEVAETTLSFSSQKKGKAYSYTAKNLPKETRSSTCQKVCNFFYFIISLIILPIGLIRLASWAIRSLAARRILATAFRPDKLEDLKYSKEELKEIKHYLTLISVVIKKLQSLDNSKNKNLAAGYKRLTTNFPDKITTDQIKALLRTVVNILDSLNDDQFKAVMRGIHFEIKDNEKSFKIENSEILETHISAISESKSVSSLNNYLNNCFGHVLSKVSQTKEFSTFFKWMILLEDQAASPLTITTPDDEKLDGIYIRRNEDPNALTVVHFMGSESTFESAYFFKKIQLPAEPAGQPYNLVLVNYRGVGSSSGTPSSPQLKIDSAATIEFVNTELNVPLSQIVASGHSLGSAFAVYAASLFEGLICRADRGFASLEDKIYDSFTDDGLPRILAKIGAAIVAATGWDWDCRQWWDAIQGYKWVIYHPEDVEIPADISLGKYAGETQNVVLMDEEGEEVHEVVPELKSATYRKDAEFMRQSSQPFPLF